MKAPPKSLLPGSLWIGGADDHVIEILGNGHKPGLKLVRDYGAYGGSELAGIQEFEMAGNLVARRHDWAERHTEELRLLLKQTGFETSQQVRALRRRIEAESMQNIKHNEQI